MLEETWWLGGRMFKGQVYGEKWGCLKERLWAQVSEMCEGSYSTCREL